MNIFSFFFQFYRFKIMYFFSNFSLLISFFFVFLYFYLFFHVLLTFTSCSAVNLELFIPIFCISPKSFADQIFFDVVFLEFCKSFSVFFFQSFLFN